MVPGMRNGDRSDGMLRTVLGLALATMMGTQAAASAVSVEGVTAGPDWDLHQEGKGLVRVSDGALELDLSAPVVGKTGWAEFVPWLRLPATLEWRQTIRRDSPHLYHTGLYLMDPADGLATIGLSGQPLNHRVQVAGQTGAIARPAGEASRFRLQIGNDRQATLTVQGDAGEERFEVRLPGLRGALLRVGFFHNQPRNQGPNAYAQDRGTSIIDEVRIEAAALCREDPSSYRDRDLRGLEARAPMSFSRALRWVALPAAAGGGSIPYDATERVCLTGTDAVTDWHANRGCSMTAVAARSSRFRRPNDLDGPDSAGIPILQWCLRQHPRLEYELAPAGGAVRLTVVLPCAYLGRGVTLFETGFASTPQRGRVDLAERLAAYRLDAHAFGEIGNVDQERGPEGG